MKVCHIKVCVTSQSLAWVSNATCIEHKLLGANVNDAKSHKDFHRRFALFGTTYQRTLASICVALTFPRRQCNDSLQGVYYLEGAMDRAALKWSLHVPQK